MKSIARRKRLESPVQMKQAESISAAVSSNYEPELPDEQSIDVAMEPTSDDDICDTPSQFDAVINTASTDLNSLNLLKIESMKLEIQSKKLDIEYKKLDIEHKRMLMKKTEIEVKRMTQGRSGCNGFDDPDS